MALIEGRQPEALFRYFEEISAIPRMSYHEEKIADYLVEFAKKRNLEWYRDSYQNVLIRKPATASLADHAPVLLQGHTDMVCEKNGDVEHDFLNDPLELYLDGDLLRARGTTLGADDGIAVAVMLAVLDGALAEHPPVECLFTASEEVGLDGATNFDYSKISARRMINMDSESLGVITAGCAGGMRSELSLPVHWISAEGKALRLSVKGLAGGHSGENIHEGRANANKLMGRLLALAVKTGDARLVSVNGGSKDNAIPRECEAVIAVSDVEKVAKALQTEADEIANELISLDHAFSFSCEATIADQMLDRRDTDRVVFVLCATRTGVFEMNRSIPSLVEYSRNLGVVKTQTERIRFVFSSRSAMESRLDASISELDALARVLDGTIKHYARYPGWNFSEKSELREAYAKAYRAVTGEEIVVNLIHAGLECGFVYASIPGIDIISIAPDLQDLHSPDEALDLASVEVFWKTFAELMKIL